MTSPNATRCPVVWVCVSEAVSDVFNEKVDSFHYGRLPRWNIIIIISRFLWAENSPVSALIPAHHKTVSFSGSMNRLLLVPFNGHERHSGNLTSANIVFRHINLTITAMKSGHPLRKLQITKWDEQIFIQLHSVTWFINLRKDCVEHHTIIQIFGIRKLSILAHLYTTAIKGAWGQSFQGFLEMVSMTRILAYSDKPFFCHKSFMELVWK